MAIKVQTCEKPCVEWSVAIPHVGRETVSDDFKISGSYWYLKLVTEWNKSINDETWTMLLVKRRYECLPSKFMLTAYARNRYMNDVYITHKEIAQFETQIWVYGQPSFLSLCPQADTPEITLKFILTFEYGIRNFKDMQTTETEHTSAHAQTSPYLECLENLSLNLCKLMDDSFNPDVQLKCGESTIPAHRLILSARSEVFRTMLQSDMMEGRKGSVEIVDMEPALLKLFIRYLYTGILPEMTVDIALCLYEAGDKYCVEALRKRCSKFLAENLTRENVCSILALADAHSDKDLKERSVSYAIEEEIPNNCEGWTKFCEDYPKVAIEVLNRAYQRLV